MNENPLDLNRLTMDDIDFGVLPKITEKLDHIERVCKEKYGDDWWEYYLRATNPNYDVDLDERSINRAIFEGHRLCISGHPTIVVEMEKKYWEKMKRLFGPFYKRYVSHEYNNPKVDKALLKDAIKSGKWKELPNELWEEYHRLAGK